MPAKPKRSASPWGRSEKRHNTKSKGHAKIRRQRAIRARRSMKRFKEYGED